MWCGLRPGVYHSPHYISVICVCKHCSPVPIWATNLNPDPVNSIVTFLDNGLADTFDPVVKPTPDIAKGRQVPTWIGGIDWIMLTVQVRLLIQISVTCGEGSYIRIASFACIYKNARNALRPGFCHDDVPVRCGANHLKVALWPGRQRQRGGIRTRALLIGLKLQRNAIAPN